MPRRTTDSRSDTGEARGHGCPISATKAASEDLRAGGVTMRGVECAIAPRLPVQQTPVLERCQFVPYIDNQRTAQKREAKVQEYVQVCSRVARYVLESCGKNKSQISDVMNGFSEASEQVLERYIESPAKNNGLLRVLTSIQNQAPRSTSSVLDLCEISYCSPQSRP
ncbi:hypothetical protein HPB48_015004 [Haemaphysalis longicornis]|uniref:Uncharacterized protein n=1 Tax=Haemaphysalis longicornis TaxID=44386 RepID=A0A9J6FV06_HAELO|nr:hypothetical protein HPB48_015004 [Haemaphysalis longicornis]